MTRYFLTIEYNGKGYVGWQRQKSGISVQQLIEEAIKGFSGKNVSIYAAGRTDSGVHASGQVAHVDLPDEYKNQKIILAINAHLRNTKIKIVDAQKVKQDAHARFSAIWREYKYTILNRVAPPALYDDFLYHQKHILDLKLMKKASEFLLGTHDFTSFRSTHCQSNSPIKTIDSIDIEREDSKIIFTFRAKSFLHHQVRNFVGSLQLIGLKKWKTDKLIKVLNQKDRSSAGPTAPASGLVLNFVKYPDSIYYKNN